MCRPDATGTHVNNSANLKTALEKAGFGKQVFKNLLALMAVIPVSGIISSVKLARCQLAQLMLCHFAFDFPERLRKQGLDSA